MASVLSKKKKQKREKHSLSDLKTLGQLLLTSRAHINNLPILLTFITPDSPPQYALESLLSLQSFFTPLVPQLPSSSSSTNSNPDPDPELIYLTWLRSKFDDFVQCLIDLVVSSESEDALRVQSILYFLSVRHFFPLYTQLVIFHMIELSSNAITVISFLQEVVLDSIMEFVKVANAGKFNSAIYHKLVRAIVSLIAIFQKAVPSTFSFTCSSLFRFSLWISK